jgi:hypothetical protein
MRQSSGRAVHACTWCGVTIIALCGLQVSLTQQLIVQIMMSVAASAACASPCRLVVPVLPRDDVQALG